jgi:hypothetical protein
MPELQEKLDGYGLKGEAAAVLGLTAVYDTFTRSEFEKHFN